MLNTSQPFRTPQTPGTSHEDSECLALFIWNDSICADADNFIYLIQWRYI